MKPHPTAGLSDARSDLEQLYSQGADLSIGKLGAFKVITQQPKQTIRKGVQKQAKLIGHKAMAA